MSGAPPAVTDRQKLRVPVGRRSDGRYLTPEQTRPGDALVCPGCGSPLLIRGGEGTKVRRHFAHRADAPCAQETILHQAAKAMVAQALQDSLGGTGPDVVVHRTCARPDCKAAWSKPFRPSADAIAIEHRLPSGRIADVGILSGERVVAVVEVHVTHEVDDAKAKDLDGIPCAELEAADVLADTLNWKPRAERARPLPCPACVEMDRLYEQAAVPRWIDEMKEGPDLVRSMRRWGTEIRLVKRYVIGCHCCDHTVFDVTVARLRENVPNPAWTSSEARRLAHVRERRSQHPQLPEHVDFYWQVEAALLVHGGDWAAPPAAGWGDLRMLRHTEDAAAESEDRWTRIRRIAAETGQWVPPGRQSPYWVEPYRCYADSCGAEMLVYSWKGHTWMTDAAPPEPRPPSLQHRYSKQAGGKYWANVCPACNRVQGENFIYAPNGPLPKHLAGRPRGVRGPFAW